LFGKLKWNGLNQEANNGKEEIENDIVNIG
jgi:hypothetical protein